MSKMYEKIKILNRNEDKDLKIDALKDFNFAKELQQCIITIDELFMACRSQPVVFAQNKEGEFLAVALLGLKEGENLFLDSKGDWKKGEYIPAYVRRYPFIFVQTEDRLVLGYDSNCKEINTKKGVMLFDKEGKPSEGISNIMKFMENYQNSYSKTNLFIQQLESVGILEDTNVSISLNGKKIGFSGFKRVNEDKLNNLSTEDMNNLTQTGAYKLAIAHLISMSNFDKLIAIADQ